MYDKYKAKVMHKVTSNGNGKQMDNFVVVTGVTPTAYGEGKSTTMLGPWSVSA